MKFYWVRIGIEWTIGSPFESESRGVFAWDLIGFEARVPDEIGEEVMRAGMGIEGDVIGTGDSE